MIFASLPALDEGADPGAHRPWPKSFRGFAGSDEARRTAANIAKLSTLKCQNRA